jgi:hypothetical protein
MSILRGGTVTREAKKRLALDALRMAQGMGWKEESLMRDYAITRLKAQGIRHDEAQRIVSAVWDEHFKIWEG